MDKYFEDFAFEGPVEGSGGGGGGGCFPAGERVFTSHGWKPIEKLQVGQLVVAYDRYGSIEHGKITAVHKHSKKENNSGIYTFTTINAAGVPNQLNVTGNHAIYCGDATESNFKQAQEFVVGESFYDTDGNLCEITGITVRDIEEDEFTYNLTIEPQHTYIVNGIRVHNGGGGKSGGASRPAQEDPNTLRSTNIARVMEVVSEGPIEGLTTNSLKDVYLNDTPVQNADNSYNFSVLQADFRIGAAVQDYVKGFNGVESVIAIGTEVKTTQDVTQLLQATTDAALVQIRLPNGIHSQNTSTGDLHGSSVTLAIDTMPTAGTWTEVLRPTITGKTMTVYDTAYRINRPVGATTWSVRVRRITADSTTSAVVDTTFVYEITEVQEVQLSYPGVAYAAIALDAQSVGNSVPIRSYDIKGIICPVPSNYNPLTRVYTGTWDGTFVSAWTDNPAWIVYDLLTDTTYGIGAFIDTTTIDIWSFYSASQYNDELVNDGSGGTEPRFTFNQPISTREDAWKLIQMIASTMRAVVVPGGIITLVQDRPSTPVKIVTNSNVKDGVFNYTGSGYLARHTAVNVLYNDATDRYLPRVVTEEDTAGIARYGYNLADLTAYGCVTEGQARRAGKWFLDTELNQTELVTYETGFNQADLIPGDVIYVMDNDYVTKFMAGRIVSSTTTSITVDSDVVLAAGSAYKITFVDADGVTIVERNITNVAGTYTVLNLDVAITGVGFEGREWMITSATDVVARQFRVVSITESEKGLFSISAIFYDPNKYARIETGITNPAQVYSVVSATTCGQVSNVVGNLESREDPVVGPVVGLRLTWDKPVTPYTVGYKVSYSRNNSPWSQQYVADNNTFIIDNVLEGTYQVQIIAFNIKGVQSAPLLTTLSVGYGGSSTLYPPTAINILAGHGSGSEWYGTDLFVEWTPDTANDTIVGQSVGGYSIKVYDNSTLTLLRTVTVPKTVTSYDYTFVDNVKDGGPFRAIKIEVNTLNSLTQPSPLSTSAVFTNTAPAVPTTFTTTNGYGQYTVNVTITTPPSDLDGIIIYQGTTAGFTPSVDNIVYQGPVNAGGIVISQVPGSYYVIGALYDTFGPYALNNTTAVAVTSSAPQDLPAPATPTGLTINAYLDQGPDGSQSARIVSAWTANTTNTSGYDVLIRDVTGSGQPTLYTTTEITHVFNGLKPSNTYGVSLRARNGSFSFSAYTAESTIATPGDTVAPSAPSSLSIRNSFKGIWLSWVKSTDADMRGSEVWAASTNDRSTATKLTTSDTDTFFHSGLTTGDTRYYWIRSIDTSGNTSAYYPTSSTGGLSGTCIGTATADYQALSITSASIADATIDNAKIVDATIQGAKIANLTVDTLQLKNGAITDQLYVYDTATYSVTFPARTATGSTSTLTNYVDTAYSYFTTPTISGMTSVPCQVTIVAPYNFEVVTTVQRLMTVVGKVFLDQSNDGSTGWTSVDSTFFANTLSGSTVTQPGGISLSSFSTDTRMNSLVMSFSLSVPMGKYFRIKSRLYAHLDVWGAAVAAQTFYFTGVSLVKQVSLK